jgi:hypothetical protein
MIGEQIEDFIPPQGFSKPTSKTFEPLVACDECAAIVALANVPVHVDWHERLRRAVDEGGLLHPAEPDVLQEIN